MKKYENRIAFVKRDFMTNIVNELEKKNLENITNEKTRNCPSCDKELFYKSKYDLIYAIQKKTCCKSCRQLGKKNHRWNTHWNEVNKKKLSSSLKGKNTWSKGRPLSESHKLNISKSNTGHNVSSQTKEKMSLISRGKNTWSKGRRHTEEYKRTMRQKSCERLIKLGIASCEDKGAREWFNKLNREFNYKFKINCHFKELGYFADAYDEYNHIWAEYDTEYHQYYKQKEKDIIRQNIIIEHFKSIGNPLKQFIRIDATNNNEMKIVYDRCK